MRSLLGKVTGYTSSLGTLGCSEQEGMERACPVRSCVPQCAAPAPHWGLSFAVVARLSLAVHFTLAGPEALTAFKHRVTDAVT